METANLIRRICHIAGAIEFAQSTRPETRAMRRAIRERDTKFLFDWLTWILSFQGISDRAAESYLDAHGSATWSEIELALEDFQGCPKLVGHWTFESCGYQKGTGTCSQPEHIAECPLPRPNLRNGRLNQSAFSLYFFIRDICHDDLVGWIDDELRITAQGAAEGRTVRMAQALIEPLRQVYGLSDKVLTMALSQLLMAAPQEYSHWRAVGASMIVVDTLVHNFLTRTGILSRLGAEHAYGLACYKHNGCADVLASAASSIDARTFNPRFPRVFPRFVQHAIWRYCAELELNICNGNQIEDRSACENTFCRLYAHCDRVPLKADGS